MEALTQNDIAVGNDGERMIIINAWGYYAHLSIYHFAIPYCSGRRVLDAGSGTGYGSAYLARHGASVLALDAGLDAVAYARQRFASDPVAYEVADLNEPLELGDRTFDTVFSSNVFEHVADVDHLAAECARVVKADGVVIVAVPPITAAGAAEADMRNQFHVHHIPPSAWLAKLERFFESVECRGHVGAGADQLTVRETDFDFPLCRPDEMQDIGSITAVYVCRKPRAVVGPETLAERTPLEWHESALAAKVISEERAALKRQDAEIASLRGEIDHLRWKAAALERSTSWRITAPLRRAVSMVRGR